MNSRTYRHLFSGRLFLHSAFVAITLLLGSAPTYAQNNWSMIGRVTGNFCTPYFLNPNVGFFFNSPIHMRGTTQDQGWQSPQLQLTTNGGTIWKTLPFFDDNNLYLSNLSFTSLRHGYAATTEASGSGGGIYETNDQGSNWKQITPYGLEFNYVYAAENVITAVTEHLAVPAKAMRSTNNGTTWMTITVPGIPSTASYTFVTGNRDYREYLIASDGIRIYLGWSTDLGETWSSELLDSYGTGGDQVEAILSVPHTTELLRQVVSSQDSRNDFYSFYRSSDPYTTWGNSLLHKETGGWIAGTGCVQYLANAAPRGSDQVYRSTDQGVSWQLFSGPDETEIDDEDYQNMSVVGYGTVVYASVNNSYQLFKTTTGASGALSAQQFAPQVAVSSLTADSMAVTPCDSVRLLFEYFNTSCSFAKLQSVTVNGVAAADVKVDVTDHFPQVDTISLSFVNSAALPTTVTGNLTFIDDEYAVSDKPFKVALLGSPSKTVSLFIKPTTIHAMSGDTVRIPLYLTSSAPLVVKDAIAEFRMNTTLLTPLSFEPTWQYLLSDQTQLLPTGYSVVFHGDENSIIGSETLLGNLVCVSYLTDSATTQIGLSGGALVSADACELSVIPASITFVQDQSCGSGMIREVLDGRYKIAIDNISPNPSTDRLHVVLATLPSESTATYSIYSATGMIVGRGIASSEFSIDVSQIPSGAYRLAVSISQEPMDKRSSEVSQSFIVNH